MLTIKEINEVSFGKAGFSGYKPEDVDDFIDEVVESFEQLTEEIDEANRRIRELETRNAELESRANESTGKSSDLHTKLAILAEKVEAYRRDEDGIKDALLSAQRIARESIQDAKDKAEIILEDAKSNAQRMMDGAKIDAAKAAKDYMAQVEAKKSELESMKRQVSTFRVSLLEMYKKHLELIDHIPTFATKEKRREAPAPQEEAFDMDREVSQSVEKEMLPQPVNYEPEEPQLSFEESGMQAGLDDAVDYSKEQEYEEPQEGEEGYGDEDLTEVGIDLRAYADIPETLQQEKSSHYSNLEFGEDVDFSNRKRRK